MLGDAVLDGFQLVILGRTEALCKVGVTTDEATQRGARGEAVQLKAIEVTANTQNFLCIGQRANTSKPAIKAEVLQVDDAPPVAGGEQPIGVIADVVGVGVLVVPTSTVGDEIQASHLVVGVEVGVDVGVTMQQHFDHGSLPKIKGINPVVGLQSQNEFKRVFGVHLPILADATLNVDAKGCHRATDDVHATPHSCQHHATVG